MPKIEHAQHQILVDGKHPISIVSARSAAKPDQAVVLAHGAGAGMDHPFMTFVHCRLAEKGFLSVKFNFAYKEKGRKAPDRQPLLEATYRAVLASVREREPELKSLIIGGKSMGGRIASHLAAQQEAIDGLYLLGYPLHPPNRKERLRNLHLPAIQCPTLFLQGTRDALCDLDLLKQNIPSIPGEVQLHIVEGGNHSFQVPKRLGRTSQAVMDELVDVLEEWIKRQR